MKKVSVIVPVYNVEDYVEKCIDSILNQTYKNIELIIIDDNSTDSSYEKILKYNDKAKIYQNKQNKGLSYTRNLGISKVTGDYVSFIDSDDFIPSDFYEVLVNNIEKNHADISVCDINFITEYKKELKVCGGQEKKEIINNAFAASSCNKLFSKDLIHELKFDIGKINEDVGIIIPMLEKYKTSYTNKTYYNYLQRENSIQNKKFSQKQFDIFDEVNIALLKLQNKNYKEPLVFNQIFLLHFYKLITIKNFFERYKWLRVYHYKSQRMNYYKNNSSFKEFLKSKSKTIRYYYKLLYFLNKSGFILLENIVILFYNFYKQSKKVTKHADIDMLIKCAQKQKKLPNSKIKVSVVIPNYNYANYLYERIYSILNQNYKIYELIILDDCSTDSSREIIDELAEKLLPYINVIKKYNKKNSGSAFKQWEKGFEVASGDYVWIAEADDYCDNNFLKGLLKNIKENVVISYANTSYINSSGYKIVNSIFKAVDINNTGHWKKSYIIEGKDEFNNYMYLCNTIPNVSSCIIKNIQINDAFSLAGNYKQSGDWLLYAMIVHEGKICFNRNVNNYYREHGNNVSTTFKKEKHLLEIKSIHAIFEEKFGLTNIQKKNISKRYDYLKKVWNLK